MHFRKDEYARLLAVYVMAWLLLALSLVGLIIVVSSADNSVDVSVSGLIPVGLLPLITIVAVLLFVIVVPRLKQLWRIRQLIVGLSKLLGGVAPSTTYPGVDGGTILVTRTEGPYYFDLTISPSSGRTANWEIGRDRINSKDDLRDPLPLREMNYVQLVYDLIKAEVKLRDEQRDRAEQQTRLQEAVDEHEARVQASRSDA